MRCDDGWRVITVDGGAWKPGVIMDPAGDGEPGVVTDGGGDREPGADTGNPA